jgi:hypothetical protein
LKTKIWELDDNPWKDDVSRSETVKFAEHITNRYLIAVLERLIVEDFNDGLYFPAKDSESHVYSAVQRARVLANTAIEEMDKRQSVPLWIVHGG